MYLKCVLRGDSRIYGRTSAPIRWPYTLDRESGITSAYPILIVTEELERAVRNESIVAIRYYWGISKWTACKLRRALGVERMNPGTSELISRVAIIARHEKKKQKEARDGKPEPKKARQ
jgi:hypothetical protein